jgi:DNA mismatch endonuclease (patch repair protein)
MSKWPGNAKVIKTTFGGLSRSELMSRIRSSGNATTELALIKILRSSGIRGWRRNYKLLGKPDFVWPKEKLSLFVDGCFWHGHNCRRNLHPMRNAREWEEKIKENQFRDNKNSNMLRRKGWKVMRIWECILKRNSTTVKKRINLKLIEDKAISKR